MMSYLNNSLKSDQLCTRRAIVAASEAFKFTRGMYVCLCPSLDVTMEDQEYPQARHVPQLQFAVQCKQA